MYGNTIKIFLVICLMIEVTLSKPVTPDKKSPNNKESKSSEGIHVPELNQELLRYAKEVTDLLQSDPNIKKELEALNEDDVDNDKLAAFVERAHLDTRDKLHEAKRLAIDRLRKDLAAGKKNYDDYKHMDISKPHQFEKDDLKKLLEAFQEGELDKEEEKKYKEYEMKKKYEHEQQLKKMNESAKKKTLEEDKKLKERIEEEEKLMKHPLTKPHLQEIWEHLGFDGEVKPEIIFKYYDFTQDNNLDENEIEAMLQQSVSVLTDFDEREKERVINRLFNHIMHQYDQDKNRFISYAEWMKIIQDKEYLQHLGWEFEDPYTDEEYGEFVNAYDHENGFIPQDISNEIPQPAGHAYPNQHNQQYPHDNQVNPGYVENHIPNQKVPQYNSGNQHLNQGHAQGVPQHPNSLNQAQQPVHGNAQQQMNPNVNNNNFQQHQGNPQRGINQPVSGQQQQGNNQPVSGQQQQQGNPQYGVNQPVTGQQQHQPQNNINNQNYQGKVQQQQQNIPVQNQGNAQQNQQHGTNVRNQRTNTV